MRLVLLVIKAYMGRLPTKDVITQIILQKIISLTFCFCQESGLLVVKNKGIHNE
jgi:hypothetical protein